MDFFLLFLLLVGFLFLIFCLIISTTKQEKIQICFGFILINLILILRLIIRLPIKITFDSLVLCIIALNIVILHLVIIVTKLLPTKNHINFKFVWLNKQKEKLVNLVIYVKAYLFDSLFTIYLLILRLFPNYSDYYFSFGYKLISIKNKYLMEILLICFDWLPKLLLLIACMIDIFVFHKFNYFYKSLWLLLIPLLFEIMLFCLNHYSKTALNQLEKDIIVYVKELKLLNHMVITYDFQYNILNNPNNFSIEYISILFGTLFKLQVCYSYIINLKSRTYINFITLFLNCGYIITWGYVLIKTLLIFFRI